MDRLLTWSGWEDEWRAESARVSLDDDRLLAAGTQLGVDYRLNYTLDAGGADWATHRLNVDVNGADWSRGIGLARDAAGAWTVVVHLPHGDVDLPPAGCDGAELEGAVDVDLALSPLTNFMPARRHSEGTHDFLMAFVEVPSLRVFAHRQRYEHLGPGRVRYTSIEPDGSPGFSAELELDDEGFVVTYPQLARRVGSRS